ncbi:MAG: PocR ligand-binding domain-containing protein [Lachnospiraceae bacterium]
MANMHISELLDVESMSVIQDGFSRMTGMASVLTDENGTPITEVSNFSRFCFELTRSTATGRARCENCDRMGAKQTMRSGKAEVYTCHAGLCDFAAPIIVDGRFLGAFVGGQVLMEEPDEEKIRETAKELGIDPDVYVEAVHEIPVLSRKTIEDAADFLCVIANIFSTMAYNNYITLSKSRELENISRMKLEFLSTINFNIHKPLQEMLFLANSINRMELPDGVGEKLRKLEKMNQTVINTLADAMSYSEMTRTDSDIVETEYDLLKLCEGLQLTYMGRLMERPVEFVLKVDEDVPTDLFGDVTRIRQILINLLNNSVQYTNEGTILLHISQKKTTYGLMLYFEITDTGIGMSEEQVSDIQGMFDRVHEDQVIDEDVLSFGLGMTSQLVSAVYGNVKVQSTLGKGSVFTVAIPQMPAEE